MNRTISTGQHRISSCVFHGLDLDCLTKSPRDGIISIFENVLSLVSSEVVDRDSAETTNLRSKRVFVSPSFVERYPDGMIECHSAITSNSASYQDYTKTGRTKYRAL